MSLLIVEAFELVDLPLPDTSEPEPGMPSEFDRKLAYWTNALFGVVPFDGLRPSFDLATRRHTDPRRPVNPIEVKEAYADVSAESKRAVARAGGDVETLPDCEYCRNERLADKWFPSLGKGARFPCDRCRPKAFEVAVGQWKERNAAQASASPIAQVVEAGKKLLGEELQCGACGKRFNTYLSRKKKGDACGSLRNASTSDAGDEGEVGLCPGTLLTARGGE